MKQVKTLKYKVVNQTKIFHDTLEIYHEVLTFLIDVIDKEFPSFEGITIKDMTTLVERLIHTTKHNPLPKYREFNSRFHKFPSYLRRSAIACAYGKVKSYRANLENWMKEKELAAQSGKTFKKKTPILSFTHKEFPVLYKGNMYRKISDTEALVKV